MRTLLLILSLLVLANFSVLAQTPAAPTVTGNRSVCAGTATTLTASGEAGATFAWYLVSTGGTAVATSAAYNTGGLSVSTHFYVSQTVSGNTSARTDVYVVVHAIPAPMFPTNVLATPATICQGQSSNLSATVDATANQRVFWYDAATGGNLIGVTASGGLLQVSPTSTKTYYAQSEIEKVNQVYNYTGGMQTFTVPAGVTSITIDALGARGGYNSELYGYGNPGGGGRVQATMSVTPGQVLYLFVGERGYGSPGCSPCNRHGASYNGGGNTNGQGAGGGGASDIRFGGTALTDRILVAGGGGGTGYTTPNSFGGAGGGLIGGNGGTGQYGATPGGGGTQTDGGTFGSKNGYNGQPGGFGYGGNGGDWGGDWGGAGGGGWYGGGGGSATSGGGGGSSYTHPQLIQNVNHTQGYNFGQGQITISYVTGSECAAATRVPVTLTVNTTPSVTAGNNVITCLGTSVTLTAGGADTYLWTPGNLTGQSVTVNPASTTTYTVTGKLNNGGCTNTAQVTVSVTSVTVSGNQSICLGQTATLYAANADSYSWQPGGMTGSGINVSPTSTTTYTVTGYNNVGCSTTAQSTVTVNPLPPTSAGADQTIAAGSIVTLTASGADTYSWYPLGSNNATISFAPSATSSYTLTGYYSATGCNSSDVVTVTVNPVTTVTGATQVCKGSTATLTASGTAPFTWWDAATGGNLLFTGTTYTTAALNQNTSIWVSSNGGTRVKVNLSISDPAAATVTATPATICPGSSSSLQTSIQTGTVKWYDAAAGGNLLGTTQAGEVFNVSPAVTKTYYAEIISGTTSQVFNYTGNMQTFTVPAGVTSIRIDALGARGGYNSELYGYGNPGGGGRVQATMNVTPGDVLNLFVGERGYGSPGCSPCNRHGASYNGGGNTNGQGAGGGGATDIRLGGTALTNRILVAGGGGGTGYTTSNSFGGAGGGLNGGNGGSGQYGATVGGGGSQVSGGAFGSKNGYNGQAGGYGYGGNGGDWGGDWGGAGGGGYFGGGGGSATSGGGGGSSYTNAQYIQNVSHTQGYNFGQGQITISYNTDCALPARVPVTVTLAAAPVVSITASSASVCPNSAVTLTASGASSYTWTLPVTQPASAKLTAGLHKLNASYNGAAIKLRRSTDNATQDIGFSGNDIDIAAVNAFLGSADGYCEIIYDQSGNGNNFIQTNTALQPLFVRSGINNRAVLRFTANPARYMTNGTAFTNPYTVIYTAKQTGNRSRMLSAANNWLLGWWGGNKRMGHFDGWVSPSGGIPADNSAYVYSVTGNGSVSTMYENSIQLYSNGGGRSAPNALQLNGWANGANELSDGDFTDVLVYNTVLSTAERTAAENATGSYYGVLSGVTGSNITVNPSMASIYSVTGTSANGCTASATQTISMDIQKPSITCPSPQLLALTAGCSATLPDYRSMLTVSDNCTPANALTIVQSPAAGVSVSGTGTIAMTFTVTDASGNAETCTMNVTKTDVTPPVITCPANIIVTAASGSCTAVANYAEPTATDNCGGTVTLTRTAGAASGSVFASGVNTITYTATDASGNTTSCSFTITVRDVDAPVVLEGTRTVNFPSGGTTSGWSPLVMYFNDPLPSNASITGIDLTFTAVDQGWGGTGAPAAMYVTDTYIGQRTLLHSSTTGTINYSGDIPTYVHGGTNTLKLYFWGYPGWQAFWQGGTMTIHYGLRTLKDQCSVTITQPPVVQDLCNGSITGTTTDPLVYNSEGTYTVHWTYTDASGNTSTQNQTVIIDDITAPVPDVATLPNVTGQCSVTVTPPTATDNCKGSITATTNSPLTYTTQGTYTITWTYNDGNGNTSTQTQTVVVDDVTAPVPNVATLPAVTGECTVTVTPPTATDNCKGQLTATTTDPLTYAAQGDYTIHWTYNDGNGNITTQNQSVSLHDVTAPVFGQTVSGPGMVDVILFGGTFKDQISWTLKDKFGVTVLSGGNYGFSSGATYVSAQTSATGAPFVFFIEAQGGNNDNLSNWQVRCNGNAVASGCVRGSILNPVSSGCSSSNTVSIFNIPGCQSNTVVGACPSNINLNVTPGSCGAVANWTAPVATDNCTAVTLTSNYNPGASFPVGVTTVTYTASDANGNISTCSFTVTVTDNIPFTVSPPADITVSNDPGSCTATVSSLGQPTMTSNGCGIASITNDHPSSTFNKGTTNVTWTVTNTSGQVATAVQHVTVNDTEPPVFGQTSVSPGMVDVVLYGGTFKDDISWTLNNRFNAPVLTGGNYGPQNGATYVSAQVSSTEGHFQFFIEAQGFHNDNLAFWQIRCNGNVIRSGCIRGTNASGCSSVGSLSVFNITADCPATTTVGGCPGNINLNVTPGTCGAAATWTPPAAFDNCAGVTVTSNYNPGAIFPVGVTTVTYTATDASGNTTNCSFTVTVTDNEAPVLSGVPASLSVECDAVPAPANVTATDNCNFNGLVNYSETRTNGNCPSSYTLTRTWSATDAAGNTTTASQVISVSDHTAPVLIGVPANVTVECDAVPAAANVTATDNCNTPTLVYSETRTNGNCISNYTLTRTWMATDACGNSTSQTQVITVQDTQAPVLSAAPANVTVECDAVPAPAVLTAVDNCSTATVVFTELRTNGSCPSSYILTRVWVAFDLCGNASSKTQVIVVRDTQAPVLSAAPADVTVECDNIPAAATLTATDNCDQPTLSYNEVRTNGNCISNYTLTRTWTATDACGNSSSKTQVITVQDTTPPVLTTSSDISVNNDAGSCGAIVNYTSTATDNCNAATITYSHQPGSFFPVGATVVTVTATDACGNFTVKTFTVTVADNQLPVITCAASQAQTADAGDCGANVTVTPPATSDNCGIASVVNSYNNSANASGHYPVGVTTITWTVTDLHGNTASCTQTITVTDNEAPAVTCAPNQVQTADAGDCGANVVVVAPVTSDNCGVASVVNSYNNTSNASGHYPVGTTTILWTVTDIHGNVSNCTQTVTVTDNENPVITCAANQAQTADAGDCGANVVVVSPVTSDNCGVASVVNSYNNTANASGHYPVGVTTITWTVTDIHGNTSNCTQTVTVTDNENPVITCAAGQTQTADAGDCGANVVVVSPATSDNCGIAIMVNSYNNSANASGHYPVGVTTITWTVTDLHGNTASCTQTITVTDNENPVVTCAPNQTKTADAGDCGANVVVVSPVTSDNCGVASVVNSYTNTSNASGHYPVGTTEILWTVTDIHGNVSTCTQTVTVTDNENPVITCAANQTQTADAGDCGANVVVVSPVTSDNCGVASVVNSYNNSPNASAHYPVGTTTVLWVVTDIHGNTSNCTQTVTVTDNERPVINAGLDQFFCFNGSQYTIPALISSDNCGIATISYAVTGATTRTGSGANASGTFNPGTSTVTWTVTDIHGNVTTDAMVVVVNPEILITIPPVSVLPQGAQPNTVYIGYAPASALTITANVTGGTAPYVYQWTSSGAGLSITTPNAAAPQTIRMTSTVAGTYTVTLKITDSKGCIKIVTQTITSVDLRCGTNNDKVTMCRTDVVNPGPTPPPNPHRPPTAGQQPVKEGCVAQNVVATLLANGASLGDCPVVPAMVKKGVEKAAEVKAEISLLAYPNPNTGQFRLRLTGMNKGNATIQLIDGNGKLAHQRNIVITSSEEEFAFNLRSLAAGIYQVRVVDGETVRVTKIVIAR